MGVISWGEIFYCLLIGKMYVFEKNKHQAIRCWKIQGHGENKLRMPCANLKTVCIMYTCMLDHIDCMEFFSLHLILLVLERAILHPSF